MERDMTAFQKQQTEICIKKLKFEKLWKLKTIIKLLNIFRKLKY